MGQIIDMARQLRTTTLSHMRDHATAASQLWRDLHISMHQKAISNIDDETQFIAFVTENNAFTFPRLVTDPECAAVAQRLFAHLDGKLAQLDVAIAESPLAGDKIAWQENGRRVSAAFLYQLCKAIRINDHVPEATTVLEIGAGYGGLARVLQLVKSRRQYIIVDLVDSLFCSYVFLASSFPNSRILWVTHADAAVKLDQYDFVFVPAHLVNVLHEVRVDLAVNTASLGEMTQDAVNQYMALLHATANCFYSHNRYGKRDMNFTPDVTHAAVVLDRDWEVLMWDLWGETGYGQAEPATPPGLEIIVKRTEPRSEGIYFELAKVYFQLADVLKDNSSLWHFCMWNSIRLFPCKQNLATYLRQLDTMDNFNEGDFFRSKLANAPDIKLGLPAGLVKPTLSEEKVALFNRMLKERDVLRRELASAKSELEQISAAMTSLLVSQRWRITAPIRACFAALRRARS